MKTLLKNTVGSLLVWQMVMLPAVANTGELKSVETVEIKENKTLVPVMSNAVIKMLRKEIGDNVDEYFTEEELATKEILQEQEEAFESLNELKTMLKDPAYTLDSIKSKINEQLLLEEQAKLIELKHMLKKIPSDKLDVMFEKAMDLGTYHSDFAMDYGVTFTLKEKQEVVLRMIQSDLSDIRSQTAKKMGILDRVGLEKEIALAESLIIVKDKDTWKKVLIVVLAVAAAGLVSWGVISATKKRYERKTREMNDQFDQDEIDLAQDFANQEEELIATFAERARLRDEGYTYQVCKTETFQKSATCAYDFLSYSGAEVCVTRCMKNAAGDEVLHQKSCTSAFVPNNCHVKNPYQAGYDDGYRRGDIEGYEDGYAEAYNDAYNYFYNQAYSEGYADGYDSGYQAGFDDGWAQAEYDDLNGSKSVKSSDRILGFKKGYREGYTYATQNLVGF